MSFTLAALPRVAALATQSTVGDLGGCNKARGLGKPQREKAGGKVTRGRAAKVKSRLSVQRCMDLVLQELDGGCV